MLNWFVKDNYMEKKIKQKEAKVRKDMHYKWNVISEVENTYQDKVC
jgi:hypothetical protein